MNKITQAAIAAKADGYEYMCSTVKKYFNTTYYHIVKIDRIIEAGKWIAASWNSYGWRGRIGQSSTPKNCIAKDHAIRKYCK